MRPVLFFVIVVVLVQGQKLYLPRLELPPAEPSASRAAIPSWGTIIQRQDNFNVTNPSTWSMRYLENSQFFRPGAPIFVMLGAEWTIDTQWLQSGQMYEMAQIHNAYMYYTEHRYYGESFPTEDLSVSNLKYLTTGQALADIAHFIIKMKENPVFTNSKVVLFGGSYGGSMAIWMREKYSHLVHAAVSSSAPVLAKVDFHEYHDIIQRTLGFHCASVITKGVEEARRKLSMGNLAKVQKDFNLCSTINIENIYDIEYFFLSIASKIGNTVQYGNPSIISAVCNDLQYPFYLSDYERLAAYSKDDTDCKGNYNHLVGSLTNTSLNFGNSRQWIYQTCTEFGYFQTSWTNTSLYSHTISVDLYNRWCLDFFGPTFTPAVTNNGVTATNAKYGALSPKVTRVISVHGTADPWSAVGLSRDVNLQAPVIVVNGTSHCADLYSLSSTDTPEMHNAKMSVRNAVAEWLQQS